MIISSETRSAATAAIPTIARQRIAERLATRAHTAPDAGRSEDYMGVRAVLLPILLLLSGVASAQTAYVKCPGSITSLPVFTNLVHGSAGRLAANLQCGEPVSVLENDGSWSKIRFRNDRIAFASSAFLGPASSPNQAVTAPPLQNPADQHCLGGTTRIKTAYGSYCGNGAQPSPPLVGGATPYQDGNIPTLLDLMMTPADQTSTGVSGLSVAQKTALSNWIIRYTQVMAALATSQNVAPSHSVVPTTPGSTADVVESQIDGDFHGWSGDTIFKLTNGQIWEQTEYDYEYEYAYRPDVTIYKTAGCYKMKVEDMEDTICVKRIR